MSDKIKNGNLVSYGFGLDGRNWKTAAILFHIAPTNGEAAREEKTQSVKEALAWDIWP